MEPCFPLIVIFTNELLFNFLWKKWKKSLEVDRISKLPDPILSSIISYLPAKEAVETSVLAKPWKPLWTYASRLDFNQNHMLESAFEEWSRISENHSIPDEEVLDAHDLLQFRCRAAISWIMNVLASHRGVLESCRIVHITNSCKNGDVVSLFRYLVREKRVKEIDLECRYIESWDRVEYYQNFQGDPLNGLPNRVVIPPTLKLCFHILASSCAFLQLTNYILKNSPFLRVCENLKTLKLNKVWLSEKLFEGILLNCVSLEHLSLIDCKQIKRLMVHSEHIKFLELREMRMYKIDVCAINLEVMVFDTLVSNWKGLVIDAPNLKVFRAYYDDPEARKMPKLHYGRVLLSTRVIFETITGYNLPNNGGSTPANVLRKLVTMCIDIDLNEIKDIKALYLALKSCISLEKLEINIQDYSKSSQKSSSSSNNNIHVVFWEFKSGVCEKLKRVDIRGYRGTYLELEFVKYLISKVKTLTKMSITVVDDAAVPYAFTEKTVSVRKASKKLDITLKIGKKTMPLF